MHPRTNHTVIFTGAPQLLLSMHFLFYRYSTLSATHLSPFISSITLRWNVLGLLTIFPTCLARPKKKHQWFILGLKYPVHRFS
ncbi:uncharacterized protein EV420DRAFT_891586 [Desarmillaria tabescens]|uniref:Uncharacterized protein n=1 Tax=Armillaria tabescens TaxID=1929756 RepID=A0AA39JPP6_ARMTA|nr:uncharacterized protein EV420DRAFT_487625 [Desarmillaria tabescens]XP_060325862.1 uncharacterized protein EV420DRAFT_891586 [Desarmillaria tabescens]KAK0433938.1 hypothetical protein EV420DRAFT_487625 [Desarmillaria tabescens]KAK0446513.1 hypothetical protein EV420DRAFT_891586 [Desarmillaria tabescens]